MSQKIDKLEELSIVLTALSYEQSHIDQVKVWSPIVRLKNQTINTEKNIQ